VHFIGRSLDVIPHSSAGFKTSTKKHQALIAEGKQKHGRRLIWICAPSTIADFWVAPGKEMLVMKFLFKYSVVFGILFGTCTSAHGLAFRGGSNPEIDPSLAISAITLLAGSLAILRIRRNK
jgi:hypothetical protein